MDFLLFLVVNATLFIRPAEIVPDLAGLPIYNVLILTNLVVALPKIIGRLHLDTLRNEPITTCVLGLMMAIGLSQLAHLRFGLAWDGVIEFSKVVLYYLILTAVIDTPLRLQRFLATLALFIAVLTTLAVLHYHGAISVPSLDAVADREIDARTGEEYVVMRLCSTGIFNDPNDLSLILIVGIGVCLFLAGGRPGGRPRLAWLAPTTLFLYALTLTYSRGGFLALVVGTMVLLQARFGTRRAALLSAATVPALFILFAGRQTEISAGEDTGQDRIQIWAEGFARFRGSLPFGIGQNQYAEQVGLVAHNSFIHAFVELGFLGGVLFLGAFAYAIQTLLALGRSQAEIVDEDLRRLRPHLLAIVSSFGFGLLTISRNYVTPTFLILGLASVYPRLVAATTPNLVAPSGPIRPLDLGLVGRSALVGLGFLVAANAFIKLFVRWG